MYVSEADETVADVAITWGGLTRAVEEKQLKDGEGCSFGCDVRVEPGVELAPLGSLRLLGEMAKQRPPASSSSSPSASSPSASSSSASSSSASSSPPEVLFGPLDPRDLPDGEVPCTALFWDENRDFALRVVQSKEEIASLPECAGVPRVTTSTLSRAKESFEAAVAAIPAGTTKIVLCGGKAASDVIGLALCFLALHPDRVPGEGGDASPLQFVGQCASDGAFGRATKVRFVVPVGNDEDAARQAIHDGAKREGGVPLALLARELMAHSVQNVEGKGKGKGKGKESAEDSESDDVKSTQRSEGNNKSGERALRSRDKGKERADSESGDSRSTQGSQRETRSGGKGKDPTPRAKASPLKKKTRSSPRGRQGLNEDRGCAASVPTGLRARDRGTLGSVAFGTLDVGGGNPRDVHKAVIHCADDNHGRELYLLGQRTARSEAHVTRSLGMMGAERSEGLAGHRKKWPGAHAHVSCVEVVGHAHPDTLAVGTGRDAWIMGTNTTTVRFAAVVREASQVFHPRNGTVVLHFGVCYLASTALSATRALATLTAEHSHVQVVLHDKLVTPSDVHFFSTTLVEALLCGATTERAVNAGALVMRDHDVLHLARGTVRRVEGGKNGKKRKGSASDAGAVAKRPRRCDFNDCSSVTHLDPADPRLVEAAQGFMATLAPGDHAPKSLEKGWRVWVRDKVHQGKQDDRHLQSLLGALQRVCATGKVVGIRFVRRTNTRVYRVSRE